jgi:hypothetical protein
VLGAITLAVFLLATIPAPPESVVNGPAAPLVLS